MKHLNKTLRYALGVFLIFLFFTLIGQAIAIAFYTSLAIASLISLVYLFSRKTNDSSSNCNSKHL